MIKNIGESLYDTSTRIKLMFMKIILLLNLNYSVKSPYNYFFSSCILFLFCCLLFLRGLNLLFCFNFIFIYAVTVRYRLVPISYYN